MHSNDQCFCAFRAQQNYFTYLKFLPPLKSTRNFEREDLKKQKEKSDLFFLQIS